MRVTCPDYTTADAKARWGEPSQHANDAVERVCPWCASWLRDRGRNEPPFERTVECVNLDCTMLKSGGCYWEPYPEGWTERNQQCWRISKQQKGE